LFVANRTGVIRIGGQLERYIAGRTVVAPGDPLLKALPDSFEPLPVRGS
jgi:hypothetical protein